MSLPFTSEATSSGGLDHRAVTGAGVADAAGKLEGGLELGGLCQPDALDLGKLLHRSGGDALEAAELAEKPLGGDHDRLAGDAAPQHDRQNLLGGQRLHPELL
jgi:hypothetical protein